MQVPSNRLAWGRPPEAGTHSDGSAYPIFDAEASGCLGMGWWRAATPGARERRAAARWHRLGGDPARPDAAYPTW